MNPRIAAMEPEDAPAPKVPKGVARHTCNHVICQIIEYGHREAVGAPERPTPIRPGAGAGCLGRIVFPRRRCDSRHDFSKYWSPPTVDGLLARWDRRTPTRPGRTDVEAIPAVRGRNFVSMRERVLSRRYLRADGSASRARGSGVSRPVRPVTGCGAKRRTTVDVSGNQLSSRACADQREPRDGFPKAGTLRRSDERSRVAGAVHEILHGVRGPAYEDQASLCEAVGKLQLMIVDVLTESAQRGRTIGFLEFLIAVSIDPTPACEITMSARRILSRRSPDSR